MGLTEGKTKNNSGYNHKNIPIPPPPPQGKIDGGILMTVKNENNKITQIDPRKIIALEENPLDYNYPALKIYLKNVCVPIVISYMTIEELCKKIKKFYGSNYKYRDWGKKITIEKGKKCNTCSYKYTFHIGVWCGDCKDNPFITRKDDKKT